MSDAKPKNTRSKFVTTFAEYQWDGNEYALVHREGYDYDGPWSLAHDVASVYVAEDYRWRNDDGSITAATWIAAENTAVSTGVSPGDNVRLRANFGETAGASGSGLDTGSWTLQFSKNGGTWTTVGAATDVQYFNSTNLTNGTAIAVINHNLAWGGAGVAQAWGDENEDGVTPSQTWSKDYAEAEFSLKFHDTNTAATDSITFRLLAPDASVITFTNVPTITLVGASSSIAAAETIAFKAGDTDGEVADLYGIGELKKDPAETIAFSHLVDLNGKGELKKDPAESIAFSESGTLTAYYTKGAWQGNSLAPYVLPIAPYTFTSKGSGTSSILGSTTLTFGETVDLNGLGDLAATTSLAFSEVVDLNGTGDLAATASIAFSETVDLNGLGDLAATASIAFSQSGILQTDLKGSTSITFSEAVDLNGLGDLAISATIAFSETVDLNGLGDLAAAESVDFSESATLTYTGTSSILAADSIDFSESATLTYTGTSSIVGNESITFSETGDLNALGDLAGSTAVAFSETVDLNGLGDLAGATSIDFSQSGILQSDLQGSTSIAFSEAADLNGLGDLATASSVAFSETATLAGSGDLATATSIDFSHTVDLNGLGDLASSVTVAFSESGDLTGSITKGLWQGSDLAPYALPIRRYTFSPPEALSGSTSIAFSETASLSAEGSLSAAESVTFGESATIGATGSLLTSESIAFDTTVSLTSSGALAASETLTFSESGSLGGTAAAANYSIAPYVLPISRYTFAAKQIALKVDESVAFSVNATLTGTGSLGGDNIYGSTTIDLFGIGIWLEGKGQLQASESIAFSHAATINPALFGSETITFSQTATLTADGQLSAFDSLSFTTEAGLSQVSSLQGSVSIDFAASPNITMFGRIQAGETVAVADSATLSGRGSLAAAESIDFSESGTAVRLGRIQGSTIIRFINPGQLDRPIYGSTTVAFTTVAVLNRRADPRLEVHLVEPRDRRIQVEYRDDRTVLAARDRRIEVVNRKRKTNVTGRDRRT